MSGRGTSTDPELLRAASDAAAALNLPPIAAAFLGMHAALTMPPKETR